MGSEKYNRYELLAVVITGWLKIIIMDWLGMRAFYISGICLYWTGYIIFRYSSDNTVLKHWGFKKESFKQTLLFLSPVIATATAAIFVFRSISGSIYFNWHVLPILFLYPLWGVVQQFLIAGLIAGNLERMLTAKFSKFYIILLSSFFFSFIHYPSLLLMIYAFIMEIIFLIVYFRWRNLWAIGLAHGWIATFLLFYVFNRDLWTELFAWF